MSDVYPGVLLPLTHIYSSSSCCTRCLGLMPSEFRADPQESQTLEHLGKRLYPETTKPVWLCYSEEAGAPSSSVIRGSVASAIAQGVATRLSQTCSVKVLALHGHLV